MGEVFQTTLHFRLFVFTSLLPPFIESGSRKCHLRFRLILLQTTHGWHCLTRKRFLPRCNSQLHMVLPPNPYTPFILAAHLSFSSLVFLQTLSRPSVIGPQMRSSCSFDCDSSRDSRPPLHIEALTVSSPPPLGGVGCAPLVALPRRRLFVWAGLVSSGLQRTPDGFPVQVT